MIQMNIFGSTSEEKLKLNVSFQHHQAASRKLILYNLGKRKVLNISVSVYNQIKDVYKYQFESISIKTAVTLDYEKNADLNNKLFEGEIEKVVLTVKNKSLIFKAEGGKFIRE